MIAADAADSNNNNSTDSSQTSHMRENKEDKENIRVPRYGNQSSRKGGRAARAKGTSSHKIPILLQCLSDIMTLIHLDYDYLGTNLKDIIFIRQ